MTKEKSTPEEGKEIPFTSSIFHAQQLEEDSEF